MKAKSSKYLLALVVVVVMVGVASNAFAVCNFHGKIWRTYATQEGSSDYAFYYITPINAGLPSYTYYAWVYGFDEALLGTLNAAHAANLSVFISSNISSCPTSGTFRNLGAIQFAWTYRSR